jgi:hypothetical protein
VGHSEASVGGEDALAALRAAVVDLHEQPTAVHTSRAWRMIEPGG